ncbi:hypothetical protein OPW41_03905 [Vibrio europaeus]|uniref:Uncharacterized protein n=1 Tax=Vibrio europaeus TaxID=300876 RepID=A0A178J9E2_9VIBR|nr:hypothetical protein [Vibrio europaeus]MDC5705009.1 hypothetical protein [Vibrio europaeus]MDC5710288.1 hypothetical protein [Vibrio europaeus]MDC5715378.1 hypothetical protein [Vibrio europaeus]MDC5719539.1 hypothetical protein [Vibrio europaeus]MDC5724573.1 hypothetical protein [Vibrio europaeus]
MKLQLLTATFAAVVISAPTMANETLLKNDLLEVLGDSPSEQAIKQAFEENQEQVLEVLATLLSSEVIDPQAVITEALTIAPEKVTEIVEVARQANVSNEVITTSALLAGLDPTVVSEATAAGIQTASATPQSIAPPAAPAVGSNGGGGNGVVSPN